MNRLSKILKISLISLLISIVLIIIGINLSGLDYIKNNNIDNIITTKKVKKIKKKIVSKEEKLSDFHSIDIDTDVADIEIKKSNENYSYIKIEAEEDYFNYSVKNDTLYLKDEGNGLFDFNTKRGLKINSLSKTHIINLNGLKNLIFGYYDDEENEYEQNEYKIKLFLVKEKYDKIHLNQSIGHLNLDQVVSKELNLKIDGGEAKILNSEFDNMNINLDFGKITVKKSLSNNNILIENNTGEIYFEDFKANEYDVNSDLGSVKLSNIEVLKKLKVENDVGIIDILLKYNDDTNYNIVSDSDIGKIHIDEKFKINSSGNKIINIELNNDIGKINLEAK